MKKTISILSLIIAFAVQHTVAQPKSQAESNKALALAFSQQLFGDKDVSAIDKYIADGYIQHNPDVADGKEALKKAVAIWFAHDTQKVKLNIQHVAAEGDLVFVHTKIKNAEGKDVSLIDIFKFSHQLIVEHWDVRQEVPEKAANAHPMF